VEPYSSSPIWDEEQEEPINQICFRPWEPDSGFHVKTYRVLPFFKKFWFWTLLMGSHMGENLKTDFQPVFTQNGNRRFWMWEPYWEPPNTGADIRRKPLEAHHMWVCISVVLVYRVQLGYTVGVCVLVLKNIPVRFYLRQYQSYASTTLVWKPEVISGTYLSYISTKIPSLYLE